MKKYIAAAILTFIFSQTYLIAQPCFAEGPDDEMIGIDGEFHPGPPFRDDDPDFRGKRPARLTEQKIAKIMEVIQSDYPQFHEKLQVLKKDHPEVFERTVHKLRRFVRNSKKSAEESGKLIDIFNDHIEFDLLIEKYRAEKDPAEKEKIKSEMYLSMKKTFDKREQMKLEMIRKIEKNLEEKKADFEKRKNDRENILKEDLDKLIRNIENAGKERD